MPLDNSSPPLYQRVLPVTNPARMSPLVTLPRKRRFSTMREGGPVLARIIHGFHVAKAPSVRQIGSRAAMSDAGIVEHYVEERRASTARDGVQWALAAGNS